MLRTLFQLWKPKVIHHEPVRPETPQSSESPDLVRLRQQLSKHEGVRVRLYNDKTGKTIHAMSDGGIPSIGIGRNMTKPISEAVIDLMLKEDIREAIEGAKTFSFYSFQNSVRKNALIELVFNMGLTSARSFNKSTFPAWAAGHYKRAANGIRNSKYARDVGPARSETIARMIETGEWPE